MMERMVCVLCLQPGMCFVIDEGRETKWRRAKCAEQREEKGVLAQSNGTSLC